MRTTWCGWNVEAGLTGLWVVVALMRMRAPALMARILSVLQAGQSEIETALNSDDMLTLIDERATAMAATIRAPIKPYSIVARPPLKSAKLKYHHFGTTTRL